MDNVSLRVIADEMILAGLEPDFVEKILRLGGESEGVSDLMHLWLEGEERGECEKDLLDCLKDRGSHQQSEILTKFSYI